jgi:hypothetical protein
MPAGPTATGDAPGRKGSPTWPPSSAWTLPSCTTHPVRRSGTGHRLFSFISINWRGRPLTDYQVIIETITATTTKTGLSVDAVLDENTYPTGVMVTKAQMEAIPLTPHQFHPEWNYTVHPGRTSESDNRAKRG